MSLDTCDTDNTNDTTWFLADPNAAVFKGDLISIDPAGKLQLLNNAEGATYGYKSDWYYIYGSTKNESGGTKMSLYQVAVVEESNEGIEAILYWTPRPIIARTSEEAKTKILLENAAEIERAQNDDRELSISWEVKVYVVPFG